MDKINKMVLNDLRFVSKEEQTELLNMLRGLSHEPQTKLIMAIFRDIVMYKEMSQAYLMQYRLQMGELKSRVQELEKKIAEFNKK